MAATDARVKINQNVCIYVLDDSLQEDAKVLAKSFKNASTSDIVRPVGHEHLNLFYPAFLDKFLAVLQVRPHFMRYEVKEIYKEMLETRIYESKGHRIQTIVNVRPIKDLVELLMPENRSRKKRRNSLPVVPWISASCAGTSKTNSRLRRSLSLPSFPCHFNLGATQVVNHYNNDVDVVVIFGHCNMYNCGPLPTGELLAALIAKINPTIIAFLGCCGGSNRYGPILKVMHLLDPKCFVGFYQRRVYVDELHETSLVAGLKLYLHLIQSDPKLNKEVDEVRIKEFAGKEETKMLDENRVKVVEYKQAIAIFAFKYAQLFLTIVKDCASDPTRFANDNSFNLHRILSKTGIDTSTCNKIPLSCLQLAIYHQMLVDSQKMKPIEISMESITMGIPKFFSDDKLNENSIKEIRTHHLHKLIPLILELGLVKLHNKSLILIRRGDRQSWMKVEHLQFLLAMLRGYWGNNTLTVIREWATFHLKAMMGVTLKDHRKYLHKYKLCCVCYALLSEYHFVRFVERSNKTYYHYELLACARSVHYPAKNDASDLCDVTYSASITHIYRDVLPSPSGPYPEKKELEDNWVDLFENYEYVDACVNVYEDQIPWNIHNSNIEDGNGYLFSYGDFTLAMQALCDHLYQGKRYPNKARFYKVKVFSNQSNPKYGHMQYFNYPSEYSYAEMKVITNSQNIATTDILTAYRPIPNIGNIIDRHTEGWNSVSLCRFVYAKFVNPSQYANHDGYLFYSDNHYGHLFFTNDHLQKISDPLQRELPCWYIRQGKAACYSNVSREKICYECKYEMQKVTVRTMKHLIETTDLAHLQLPFVKLGRLTLNTQNYLLSLQPLL